jgi:hypothetical protein
MYNLETFSAVSITTGRRGWMVVEERRRDDW